METLLNYITNGSNYIVTLSLNRRKGVVQMSWSFKGMLRV